MTARPLLMIPGPIEVSDAVAAAVAEVPRAHTAPDLSLAHGRALDAMVAVWRAQDDATPFVMPGGGTAAMETVATNVIDPGQSAVVVVTGLFGHRMAEMLRRRGASVTTVEAAPGEVPSLDAVADAVRTHAPAALFATHVDTSTGVRIDPAPLAALARAHGALSVFDGVCATAGETFEQAAWDADVYLTASQKAIGLPPGLSLWVASARAMAAREALRSPPPLTFDWLSWAPIMREYRARKAAYFSTPATTLVWALDVSLAEILAADPDPALAMRARWAAHDKAATALRAAWAALGLRLLPTDLAHTANTLSALWLPDGVTTPDLLREARARGVAIAGGLHPAVREKTFRVGHMGVVTGRSDALRLTVRAVGEGLAACGHRTDVPAALMTLDAGLA